LSNRLFVTGHRRGLGRGFIAAGLARDWRCYGVSRQVSATATAGLHEANCDLADPAALAPALEELLAGVSRIELVILNAGLLGPIRDLSATPMAEIERVMQVNVWANKRILDWLLERGLPVDAVLMISSGAAVIGQRGWGAYALSKATLNMLAQLYAHEFPATRLVALAPGLVDTGMQAVLCDPLQTDAERYPSLQSLRTARGSGQMPSPREAAERILTRLPDILARPSGSFVDIRDLER